MKKNSEYVGVNDDYIPENEKYVDEDLSGNKEKRQKTASKFAKGYIIFIIVFMVIVFTMVIGGMVFAITTMFRTWDSAEESSNKISASSYNFNIDHYGGKNHKVFIENMLEKIVEMNKTIKERSVRVVYNDIDTSDEEEITKLKYTLNDREYEVKLDYDSDGYIYKVTIRDIESILNSSQDNKSTVTVVDDIKDKVEEAKESIDYNNLEEEIKSKAEDVKEQINSTEVQKQLEEAQKKAEEYLNSDAGQKQLQDAQKKAEELKAQMGIK